MGVADPCSHGHEHGGRGTVHTAEGWQPIEVPFITVHPLTDEQIARFRADWERKRHGHPKVLGLPWHVRLRLAVTSAIDSTAIWLCRHGRYGMAERLWRLFGMWR